MDSVALVARMRTVLSHTRFDYVARAACSEQEVTAMAVSNCWAHAALRSYFTFVLPGLGPCSVASAPLIAALPGLAHLALGEPPQHCLAGPPCLGPPQHCLARSMPRSDESGAVARLRACEGRGVGGAKMPRLDCL